MSTFLPAISCINQHVCIINFNGKSQILGGKLGVTHICMICITKVGLSWFILLHICMHKFDICKACFSYKLRHLWWNEFGFGELFSRLMLNYFLKIRNIFKYTAIPWMSQRLQWKDCKYFNSFYWTNFFHRKNKFLVSATNISKEDMNELNSHRFKNYFNKIIHKNAAPIKWHAICKSIIWQISLSRLPASPADDQSSAGFKFSSASLYRTSPLFFVQEFKTSFFFTVFSLRLRPI